MAQIRITPEGMRTRAGEYRTEEENLDAMITRLNTLMGNLQSEWEGSASDAYAQRYTDLKSGFESARDLLGEIATALDSVAEAMEELDFGIANQILT